MDVGREMIDMNHPRIFMRFSTFILFAEKDSGGEGYASAAVFGSGKRALVGCSDVESSTHASHADSGGSG